MPSARVLGEAIQAINQGDFAKVKNVGILIFTNKPRRGRRPRTEKTQDKVK